MNSQNPYWNALGGDWMNNHTDVLILSHACSTAPDLAFQFVGRFNVCVSPRDVDLGMERPIAARS